MHVEASHAMFKSMTSNIKLNDSRVLLRATSHGSNLFACREIDGLGKLMFVKCMNLYYGIYDRSFFILWLRNMGDNRLDNKLIFYINTDQIMTMIMEIAVWIIPIIKINEKDKTKQIKINIKS